MMTFIMTIRRDYMTMAWLDMTWAMTVTASHIYIMAFILLINIMRRFHGPYAPLRMARFHALIPMGGTHLHCVQRTVSFLKDGESLTSGRLGVRQKNGGTFTNVLTHCHCHCHWHWHWQY